MHLVFNENQDNRYFIQCLHAFFLHSTGRRVLNKHKMFMVEIKYISHSFIAPTIDIDWWLYKPL